ncbi:MAG: hypothetical protein HYT94_00510 [Parcubacteria group bacterium]|nr:hypothetical protein [Parcubacteria group bacterium]
MQTKSIFSVFRIGLVVLVTATALVAGVAEADHSWGGYHFARMANPLTLKLGDNVSTAWDSYLGTASADWSLSPVLDAAVVSGKTNSKNCRAVLGRVEVCNSKYGNNGWLGIASVWVSGGHITQGTVKLNDTYFNTATYNTPAWRNLVMCQEIGHTFGLDHQDEIFNNPNLGTCMDYTNDPSGTLYGQLGNEHPNLHDYEELEAIYAHLDTINTASQGISSSQGSDLNMDDPREWGEVVRVSKDGQRTVHERNLGKGEKVFTFVIWAE